MQIQTTCTRSKTHYPSQSNAHVHSYTKSYLNSTMYQAKYTHYTAIDILIKLTL